MKFWDYFGPQPDEDDEEGNEHFYNYCNEHSNLFIKEDLDNPSLDRVFRKVFDRFLKRGFTKVEMRKFFPDKRERTEV